MRLTMGGRFFELPRSDVERVRAGVAAEPSEFITFGPKGWPW